MPFATAHSAKVNRFVGTGTLKGLDLAALECDTEFKALGNHPEAGTPLSNNCGELVRISDFRPGGRVPKEDQDLGSSGDLPTLKAFLTTQGVEFQIAAGACPSLADQLTKS